jgi:arylsulfatase
MVDLFPTLARIAGGAVPDDRVVDGLDQTPLFFGETERSPRESVLFFSGRTLLAVKWRRFKIFLTGDDPAPRNRAWRRLWAPLVYNVEQDPREEVDIGVSNLWILEPMMKRIYPFLFSIDEEGLILPGGDEPTKATVEIPFQREDEIEQSMSSIRWKMIRKKIEEMVPFGQE